MDFIDFSASGMQAKQKQTRTRSVERGICLSNARPHLPKYCYGSLSQHRTGWVSCRTENETHTKMKSWEHIIIITTRTTIIMPWKQLLVCGMRWR